MFNIWAPAKVSVCKSQKKILIIEYQFSRKLFPNPHALMSVPVYPAKILFILCLELSGLNKSFCLITVSTFIWCTNYFLIDSMPSYITWGVGLAALIRRCLWALSWREYWVIFLVVDWNKIFISFMISSWKASVVSKARNSNESGGDSVIAFPSLTAFKNVFILCCLNRVLLVNVPP